MVMNMIKVNPLMSVASVRDLPINEYWVSRIDFVDKVIIKNYEHGEAHDLAQKYLFENPFYTHLLIYAEDCLATPDMVRLLISDAEEHDFPVVSGWLNWDFKTNWASVTWKDLSKKLIFNANQYKFPFITDVATCKLGFPFAEPFFVGLPLTLIRRDILEKIPLKPYKFVVDRILGEQRKRGIMFDLSFCSRLREAGIPLTVDMRCATLHWGRTTYLINIKDKKQTVEFIPKN